MISSLQVNVNDHIFPLIMVVLINVALLISVLTFNVDSNVPLIQCTANRLLADNIKYIYEVITLY